MVSSHNTKSSSTNDNRTTTHNTSRRRKANGGLRIFTRVISDLFIHIYIYIYIYIRPAVTTRLNEIRETTNDIENTALQPKMCFQNNHEYSSLEAHIRVLQKILPFTIQVLNNIFNIHLKVYYFIILFNFGSQKTTVE